MMLMLLSHGIPLPLTLFSMVNRWQIAVSIILFRGKRQYAAAAPHLGRSALDACELMNVGVNYMREHIPDSARVHYAYLDAGGVAPNVVQANATVRQLIRAEDLETLRDLIDRGQQNC